MEAFTAEYDTQVLSASVAENCNLTERVIRSLKVGPCQNDKPAVPASWCRRDLRQSMLICPSGSL